MPLLHWRQVHCLELKLLRLHHVRELLRPTILIETKNSLSPNTLRPTRRAPPRSKKPLDDWRRLVKPPIRSPKPNKLSIDLKIITSLKNTPDEPVVEPVTADTEEMDVDPDPDESNDVEKDADEADEEAFPSR